MPIGYAARSTSETHGGASAQSGSEPEALMHAMMAACAYISRADGRICASERRRTEKLVDALHGYAGFSRERAMLEFNSHLTAFELNPSAARRNTLNAVAGLKDRPADLRIVLSACQHVLEADGVYHRGEYEALQDIGRAIARA